jgi:hypothetical protein
MYMITSREDIHERKKIRQWEYKIPNSLMANAIQRCMVICTVGCSVWTPTVAPAKPGIRKEGGT